jgi:hypothetical protein
MHYQIDHDSVRQAGDNRLPCQDRLQARYEHKKRRPNQCDEEMKGKAEKCGGEAPRVSGTAEKAARDRLRHFDRSYPSNAKEDNRFEHVEDRGHDCTDDDSFRDRAVQVVWHAKF